MDVGEPAGVFFFVDEEIVRLLGAEAMTPDLQRAVVLIELYIEEGAGVAVPHHAAIGLLDEVVEILPGCPITNPNGEIFRTLGVSAPGLKPMIGRMPRAAELEIFMRGSELIAVKDDLGVAAVARSASEQL